MRKIKVLLAEDDYDFGSILSQYLNVHDFEVTWATNGNEALSLFQDRNNSGKEMFNICIFDVMMDGMDGFTLADKTLKINPDIPFIFLTAKKLKEDKIKGLKLGADDYIVKPFDVDILILKLHTILKRTMPQESNQPTESVHEIGKYVFDVKSHSLKLDDNIQQLTVKETQVLEYLVSYKNQLIKREDLLKELWGTDDYFSGRSMDVYISRLRKCLQEDSSISIEVIRGLGLTLKLTNEKAR